MKAQHICDTAGRLCAIDNGYGPRGAMFWEAGGITFAVLDPPTLTERGDLRVEVRAHKGKKDLPLEGANPFYFRNPPIAVREEDAVNVNPERAFRAMLEEAVLTAARLRGWK